LEDINGAIRIYKLKKDIEHNGQNSFSHRVIS